MKNDKFVQLSQEWQGIMVDYLKKAGISKLKSKQDFEHILAVIVNEYVDTKLSVDEFSATLGTLSVILEKNRSLENAFIGTTLLEDYLMMGSEISWGIRHLPERAAYSIKALLSLTKATT